MTVKAVQEAIVKSTVVSDICHNGGGYLNESKFRQELAGERTAILTYYGGGGSFEASGSESQQYDGAIVVAAPEAFESEPGKLDGQYVSLVLGLKLKIDRSDCAKKTTTGELTVYQGKSNGQSVTVKFPIK
jgi:hypothetical protein